MFNSRLINTKVAGGGGCTDIVDNYDPFDGNGVALYQLNGNANDSSPNAYNGTWSGTEAYTTGVFGQAGSFNGSSKITANSLAGAGNFFGQIQTFTLSIWFKTTSTSLMQIFTDYAGQSFNLSMSINVTLGKLTATTRYSDNSSKATTSNASNLNDGAWHNVVVTMSGAYGVRNIYIDGQFDNSIALGGSSWNNTATQTVNFFSAQVTGYEFNGQGDQVRIFNTALTPLEVEALYTEELCICDGTVDTLDILGDGSCIATYQLDGNANDLSGNYSGTPTNVSYGVGEFDLAGVFNGSSSVVNFPAYFSNPNTNSSTLSIWFKSNINDGNLRSIFANRNVSGGAAYDIYTINGILRLAHEANLGGNGSVDGTTTVTDGSWHHIAVVLDNPSGVLNIYLDGNTSTAEITLNFTANSSLNLFGLTSYIGSTFFVERYFNGSIDQVRIFNKALNSSEVTTLYNETACTKAACTGTTNTLDILGDGSCVAAYPLDGSPADLSGNYNGVQTDVTYPQGYFDLAGSFNREDANGSVVQITNDSFFRQKQTYSVSLWFKISNADDNHWIFTDYNSVSYNILARIQSTGELRVDNRYNNVTNFYTSTNTYDDGNWHHLVIANNVSNLTQSIYLDNSLLNATNMSSNAWNTGLGGEVGIGAFYSTSNARWQDSFGGEIDQVRIFNKALSAGEVTTLYNETACN